MSSLLQQLQNNEAVLLMYLAGELPPEDRREVEQLLAGDISLRRELESLRRLQADLDDALAIADAAEPVTGQWSAARQVAAAVGPAHARRLAATPPAPQHRLHFTWWAYPASAAAAVLVAMLVWWSSLHNTFEQPRIAYFPDAGDTAPGPATSGPTGAPADGPKRGTAPINDAPDADRTPAGGRSAIVRADERLVPEGYPSESALGSAADADAAGQYANQLVAAVDPVDTRNDLSDLESLRDAMGGSGW